jgi:hypothetical protein
MDPRSQSGPDPRCPARGQAARGDIEVRSYPERRFRCTPCRKTFAASTGTPLYRLHKDPALFVRVTTWLAYGCPTRAILLESRPSPEDDLSAKAGSLAEQQFQGEVGVEHPRSVGCPGRRPHSA